MSLLFKNEQDPQKKNQNQDELLKHADIISHITTELLGGKAPKFSAELKKMKTQYFKSFTEKVSEEKNVSPDTSSMVRR